MAVALSTLPIRTPDDLIGVPNGHLPSTLLRMTLGGDYLHHVAANAFDLMYRAALAVGLELRLTDGYRPYETQVRLFTERYTPSYLPLRNTLSGSKVWNGRRWWKRVGVATAAVPGTSNHGDGLAIDVNTTGLGSQANPGPKLTWLAANARGFGFTWELVPEEPWHLVYFPGFAMLPPAPAPTPQPDNPRPEDEIVNTIHSATRRDAEGKVWDITYMPFTGAQLFGRSAFSAVFVRRQVATTPGEGSMPVTVYSNGVPTTLQVPNDGRSAVALCTQNGLQSVNADFPVHFEGQELWG